MAAVAITADRDQELVRRALEEHVLAYLVKPVGRPSAGTRIASGLGPVRGTAQPDDRERQSCGRTLQNRKIIERAKGVLMKRHRWSEAEAFRRFNAAP